MITKEYYLDNNINNRLSPGEEQISTSQSFNTTGRCSRRSRCKKPTCIYCGAKDNFIHKKRQRAIHKRINTAKISKLRYFVFTLPLEVRSYFYTAKALNQFFKLVLRVIKQFFGVEISRRDSARGIEIKYSLQKECFATLHLHGDHDSLYHPHINVIIIEHYPDDERFRLFNRNLPALRESYRRGLEGIIGRRIEKVVINYRYICGEKECANCIKYVATPPDPTKFKLLFDNCLHEDDFKNFRFIRFWGKLSNSEYNVSQHVDKKQFEIACKSLKPINNNPASRRKGIQEVSTGKDRF